MKDLLKEFFDDLAVQKAVLEYLTGILGSESYLNVIFGYSDNFIENLKENSGNSGFGSIEKGYETNKSGTGKVQIKYFEGIRNTDESGTGKAYGYYGEKNTEKLNKTAGWLNILNDSRILYTDNEFINNIFEYRDFITDSQSFIKHTKHTENRYISEFDNIFNYKKENELYEEELNEYGSILNNNSYFDMSYINGITEKTIKENIINASDIISYNFGEKENYFGLIDKTISPNRQEVYEKKLTDNGNNVSITLNNYSNISSKADEESIIDSITKRIIEYAQSGAEGVHI